MNKKIVIIAGVVILVLAIAVYLFTRNNNSKELDLNTGIQSEANNQQLSNTDNTNNKTNSLQKDDIYRVDPREPMVLTPDEIPDITIDEEWVDEKIVVDWEEPPVVTIYNEDADLNSDGHVDKSEWEQWIVAHPEDLNQDLQITSEEEIIYIRGNMTQEEKELYRPITDVDEYIEQQAKYNEEHQEEYRQEIIESGHQDKSFDDTTKEERIQMMLEIIRQSDPDAWIDENGNVHTKNVRDAAHTRIQ